MNVLRHFICFVCFLYIFLCILNTHMYNTIPLTAAHESIQLSKCIWRQVYKIEIYI